MESKILELQKMVSRYKTTWSQIQEQMNEFTLVYVARWRGKDGKRYASPFKTKDSAEKKAKELKSKGNSEVSVTQDTLRGNIKFKSDNSPDIKGMQKEESIKEDGHTDVPSSKRMAQVIGEDAQLILQELNKKSDEETLPTWWTNKLATSAHNMNAARDYISNDIKEDLDEGYRTVGNEKGTEWKVYKDGKLIKTFTTYIQAHDYVKQQKEELEESAAAREIDRTNTRKDSMDYQMYKKSAEL